MNKRITKITSFILAITIIFSVCNYVFANSSNSIKNNEAEYSEAYKAWLNLPDEEKIGTAEPIKYKIDVKPINEIANTENVLKNANILLRTGNLPATYDLRNILPANSRVKDQNPTGTCWAFASLASLESFLAMQDKKASKPEIEYDFSEKHITYATTRTGFLNNAINEKGMDKDAESSEHPAAGGGNMAIASGYMTGEMGPIADSEMPFTIPFEEIDISEINNKTKIATLYDVEFVGEPSNVAQKQEIIRIIKEHIMSDGGVYCEIHGAQLMSDIYDNETGALYAPNSSFAPNHAVEIVGWDDAYPVNNFKEGKRPNNPGAFIAKNSWGDEFCYGSLDDCRVKFFNTYRNELAQYGITSASQVTDEMVLSAVREMYGENKVRLDNGKIYVTVGDNGYVYISYEDYNVLNGIALIQKAEYGNKIKKVFQNEYVGPSHAFQNYDKKFYLASVFTGSTAGDQISSVAILNNGGLNNCKVYINPNGTDKNLSNLQLVELQAGESENLEAGFHTLEFANPVTINGSSFFVAIEVNSSSGAKVSVAAKTDDGFPHLVVPNGTTFIGSVKNNNIEWEDMATYFEEPAILPIRAYITSNAVTPPTTQKTLSSISITKAPTITTYNVGDAFDKTGMEVKATYSDGTSQVVTNYTVTNGTSLTAGQTSVTISYTEGGVTKIATQNITVNGTTPTQKTLSLISITKAPTKTTYNAGDNFDKTGMEVKAIYLDGTSQVVTNYTVVDGTSLTAGQTSVTISYTEGGVTKEATQPITVKAVTPPPTQKTLSSISITKAPTKTTYNEGESFDKTGMEVKATYSDGTSQVVTNYIVTDGNNLTKAKTYVTISYTEGGVTKITTQVITVKEKEKEHPTLSNLSDANAKVTKASSYKYVEKANKEDYSVIEIDLSGIKIGDTKSDRTFSYYLSTKKGETNIEASKWTEFDVNGTVAKIEVDTRELSYAKDLITGDNLFMYIKEVAKLNGESTDMTTTLQLKNESELKLYVDDKLYDSSNRQDPPISENGGNGTGDNTTANGQLPNTGVTIVAGIVGTIVITTIAGVSYYRYKNIIK